MKPLQKWIAILLAMWTLQAEAEDAAYGKNGLMFSGSAEAVKAFREASIAYDEAERVQQQLRKQPLPSTPENDQHTQEAIRNWHSSRDAMFAAALDMKIAPGEPDQTSSTGVDAIGTRTDIRMLNQFVSNYREAHAESPALYMQWLREMLPAWKDKAGEADILLEMARLSENEPAVALTYYERAAKNDRDVDEYKFRRQQAYQGIARMHEKLGNFKAAIEALNLWDIREPCGTGANGSRIRRMFWVWRLRRLDGEASLTLRQELVRTLKTDGWLISDAERDIIAFYGKDKSALRKDVSDVILTFEKPAAEDTRIREHDIKVLKAIITQLDEEKKLAAMADDVLIRSLNAPRKRMHDDRPPTPIPANVLYHNYTEQKTSSLLEIPDETRFWVRTAEEALKRMPALEEKLKSEWRKTRNYGAALVLALHAMPDEPAYLRAASKSDGELQIMLDDMIRDQQSMRSGR